MGFHQFVRKWALPLGVHVPPGALPEHDLPNQQELLAKTEAQDYSELSRGTLPG